MDIILLIYQQNVIECNNKYLTILVYIYIMLLAKNCHRKKNFQQKRKYQKYAYVYNQIYRWVKFEYNTGDE